MKIRFIFFLFLFLLSCTSGILKIDRPESIAVNEEFDRKVQITETVQNELQPDSTNTVSDAENKTNQIDNKSIEKKETQNSKTKKKKTLVSNKKRKHGKAKEKLQANVEDKSTVRQPVDEDSEGFAPGDRRPLVMPFHVGEKVVHEVSYFKATAGKMNMMVKPMTEVNGRKSYRFVINLKTAGLFSSFYSVDDEVETFLDYDTLVPSVFKLHIKESGQLKEAQCYFDNDNLKASYWEKKYTEKSGHEEKKINWDILAYAQNAFSGLYYMRVFTWKVGKEIAFHVSDDGKNVIFKGKAIAKEKLKTDAGTFDALKIKAEVVSRGALSQTGNLFLWLSDDEHKYVLRMEMEIKIGTIVSEAIQIVPGKD